MRYRRLKQDNISESFVSSSILGTYEGECADANITNLNGLDITRPVWENVFNSEEYAKGIKLGHYIGFLGHPHDPGCMDFRNACIVMREGHIADDGKVYGRFDLVDTPVGRVVKTFQDAGVKFGISVRGAGEIYDNSVEPGTFNFRGFDLVAFPAYPDAIPEFSAIAASTDAESRKKYKMISSAVKDNVQYITSSESLDVLKSAFAAQSDEYKLLEDREKELAEESEVEPESIECNEDSTDTDDILRDKIHCVTSAYVSMQKENARLQSELKASQKIHSKDSLKASRKLKVIERICSSQIKSLKDKYIKASETIEAQKKENSTLSNRNLKYKQRIATQAQQISDKEKVIASLQTQVNETVNASASAKSNVSDLDAANRNLKSEIKSAKKLLKEYQEAYAELYSSAVCGQPARISITASMSVSDIQAQIKAASTSTYAGDVLESPDLMDSYSDDDFITL